ncbi:DSS1/SEM1 [Dillenia turbinata]|uniref:26S proteasome complex subunit SEM1 n=1 Tax=Dillenia turbinata TaxID=194707 RepID=A0AAN8UZ84_9MAGN
MRVGIMAAEPKATTEEAKIDLFEDDDEFEEFEIDEGDISVLVLALILTCYSKLIANLAPLNFLLGVSSLVFDGSCSSSLLAHLLTIATTYLMVALIDEWEDKEATKEVIQQWEDDWDDDDVNDDFSLQLRRELEGPAFNGAALVSSDQWLQIIKKPLKRWDLPGPGGQAHPCSCRPKGCSLAPWKTSLSFSFRYEEIQSKSLSGNEISGILERRKARTRC